MKQVIKPPMSKMYVVKCHKCKCKYKATINEFYSGAIYKHIDCPVCGHTRHFETLWFLRKVKN